MNLQRAGYGLAFILGMSLVGACNGTEPDDVCYEAEFANLDSSIIDSTANGVDAKCNTNARVDAYALAEFELDPIVVLCMEASDRVDANGDGEGDPLTWIFAAGARTGRSTDMVVRNFNSSFENGDPRTLSFTLDSDPSTSYVSEAITDGGEESGVIEAVSVLMALEGTLPLSQMPYTDESSSWRPSASSRGVESADATLTPSPTLTPGEEEEPPAASPVEDNKPRAYSYGIVRMSSSGWHSPHTAYDMPFVNPSSGDVNPDGRMVWITQPKKVYEPLEGYEPVYGCTDVVKSVTNYANAYQLWLDWEDGRLLLAAE